LSLLSQRWQLTVAESLVWLGALRDFEEELPCLPLRECLLEADAAAVNARRAIDQDAHVEFLHAYTAPFSSASSRLRSAAAIAATERPMRRRA